METKEVNRRDLNWKFSFFHEGKEYKMPYPCEHDECEEYSFYTDGTKMYCQEHWKIKQSCS